MESENPADPRNKLPRSARAVAAQASAPPALPHRPFLSYPLVRIALFLLLAPYALAIVYRFVPPVSTLMLADYAQLQHVERHWVPLNHMSPHLITAVVSSEDDAFCSHYGFDFRQMRESIEEAVENGQPVHATSTITQQVAKNLFLWNSHSPLRKILEAPLTLWLELTWPKRRILEVYLNIAEWGDGVYGAEAASRVYFNTSSHALTAQQASLLATSLPDPLHRRAGSPGEVQQVLAGNLRERMDASGPSLGCLR